MKFTGIYKSSKSKSSSPQLHRFCIATDYPDIDRIENGYVPAEGYLFRLPEDTEINVVGEWDKENNIFKASKVIPFTGNEKFSLQMIKTIIKEIKITNSSLEFSSRLPKMILAITGNDILKYAETHNNANELKNAYPNIDEIKFDLIFRRLKDCVSSYEIIPYLADFGVSIFIAEKIGRKYGLNSIQRMKKHPYSTGYEVGMPFSECDIIAKKEGLDGLNKERILYMARECMNDLSSSNGSTFCYFEELKEMVIRKNKISAFSDIEIPASFLIVLLSTSKLFKIEIENEEIKISLKYYWLLEQKCIKHIKRLQKGRNIEEIKDEEIEILEKENGIKYADMQKEAIKLAGCTGINIITGGPGMGKTTVIKGFLTLYKKMYPQNKIALCAPTGRAAQRMSDVMGDLKASTIHKLLDIRLFNDEIMCKNEDNPVQADLIVIDEVSMMDIEIFAKLLAALKNKTTLLLVGDEDQLKSVGAGNVLHDLLKSEKFNTIRLNKGFRQESNSLIVKNAYKILNGEIDLEKGDDFQIINCSNVIEAQNKLLELFDTYYDKNDPMKTQILCDVKKYDLGTNMINHKIEEKLFPMSSSTARFHKGDKVIMTKNNYDSNYFNGDFGIITEIFPEMIHININGNLISVNREDSQDIQLAYAVSIHKSQGSEYENVIISLPKEPINMLTRNILYTGITRAKKKVIIVSTGTSVSTAIRRTVKEKIKTNFSVMLFNL